MLGKIFAPMMAPAMSSATRTIRTATSAINLFSTRIAAAMEMYSPLNKNVIDCAIARSLAGFEVDLCRVNTLFGVS